MLDIRAANIITGLVDQLLDKSMDSVEHSDDYDQVKRPGMLFNIWANASDHSGEESVEAYRNVFVLVCGHSVFVAVQNTLTAEKRWTSYRSVPLEDWINTSNHDSCWRSDGIDSPLTDVYFNLCEEVNNQLPERKAPSQLHSYHNFGTTGIFKNVSVTHARLNATDSYRRKLVDIVGV